jgi:hypothetical protein
MNSPTGTPLAVEGCLQPRQQVVKDENDSHRKKGSNMDTEGTDQTAHPMAASRRREWRGAALIAVALWLAACGGGSQQAPGSSRSSGGSSSLGSPISPNGNQAHAKRADAAQLLKLAECMRSHGVTNYPDPSSSGFSTPPPNSNSPAYQAAQRACGGK